MVNSSVPLVEIVLRKCHLNIPPWPQPDLVSRDQRSARFQTPFATACTAAVSNYRNVSAVIFLPPVPTSNNSGEVSDVTHQFSLDQLVVQREFHSSSSSMLNLIDVVVLVHLHVLVTIPVLRARLKPSS